MRALLALGLLLTLTLLSSPSQRCDQTWQDAIRAFTTLHLPLTGAG